MILNLNSQKGTDTFGRASKGQLFVIAVCLIIVGIILIIKGV